MRGAYTWAGFGRMRGTAAPARATRDVICVQGTQESQPQFLPTLKS